MLAAIAADHGARHVETLTGFKWLSRADADLPGCTLVYAYEEAIGYCVDPSAVRDKDGISAAVLFCDLVVALREQGRTVLDALDDLARRHGVHTTTRGVATRRRRRRRRGGDDPAALHAARRLCGFDVTVTDLLLERGQRRTDALIFSAAATATGAGGGAAVGYRAEGQVLHRGSLREHTAISRPRVPGHARSRTNWPSVAQRF